MSLDVTLDQDMTIVHAQAQRDQLLAALDGADDGGLTLDLAGVESIDSAGIQLLLATRRSLHRGGKSLVLSGALPAVVQTLELYGLQALLPAATGEAS